MGVRSMARAAAGFALMLVIVTAARPSAAGVEQFDDPLDIWIGQAAAAADPTVGTVTLNGGYACRDDIATPYVAIEVTLWQNNGAHGATAVSAPCQTLSGTWTAAVLPAVLSPAFAAREATIAQARIVKATEVTAMASTQAIVVADQLLLRIAPSVEIDAQEAISLAGTYSCAPVYSWLPIRLTAAQTNVDGAVTTGTALIRVPCPAVEAPWQANVEATSSLEPNDSRNESGWGFGRPGGREITIDATDLLRLNARSSLTLVN